MATGTIRPTAARAVGGLPSPRHPGAARKSQKNRLLGLFRFDRLAAAGLDQKPAVWVAEVADRMALVRLIRAALLHGVTPVALAETHLCPGVHTLQLRVDGRAVVVLAAELAGETATGSYALRLAPLDPSHVPELRAIIDRDGYDPEASVGPMSKSASAIFDSEPPLAAAAVPSEGMWRFTKTIRDPEPHEVDDDDLEASVLFDPEAALISRAPSREGAGPDESLTIPLRASMMPPGMPGSSAKSVPPPAAPRAPDPREISHLSIPSSVPITERLYPGDVDVEIVSDGTLSVTVDFDTSQSNVSTQRDWQGEDGPGASDPSLAGSVVFDLDVLTREQLKDKDPQAETQLLKQHPADLEGYSVVFGTEPTSPGSPSAGARASPLVGVVVAPTEDLSLTPTLPMDVPPRRPRHSLNDTVREDGETHPMSPEPFSSKHQEVYSGRGPRTMRRAPTTDVVVAGRIIANRYRIESLVGAGAVGAVYKASHVDLPRTFAIKVLHPHFRADPQLMASFRTEARAASLLDHPNVTVVHDFGEEPDGLVYIVMEYLAGANLQAILDEERRLGWRRAIQIMLQVCGALSAAHERGIVHRDVKPDNIMLILSRDDEGRVYDLVKVCDFGIAALESTADSKDDEWTAGTPEYMAPEQSAGRADARTDVYACGIVLYEMVTGRPPFVADSPIATLAKHATEMARRPSEIVPGLPPPLEAAIMQAIEKAPERRFPTIRDLRVELKRLL